MIRVSLKLSSILAWYHGSLGKRKKEISKLEKEWGGRTSFLFLLIHLEKIGRLIYN